MIFLDLLNHDDNHYYEKIGKQNRDITEEIDFFVPNEWSVTRFANVCEMSTGNSISEDIKEKKYKNRIDGLNYIGTKDVGFDRTINYENGVKIPKEDNFKIAHKGSILLCIEGGSAGRKIAITEKDVCYGNKLCSFETQGINNRFIFYYLQSSAFCDHFRNNINGIIGGVSINNLKRMLMGIPPLAEQERIVNKIEELFSEIDKIEKAQDELDNLKEMARTKVLDLAVRGKLVKQDPNDEPASVLLEKIKQEKEKLIKEGKIKRDKNKSVIYKGDGKNYYEKIGNKFTNITEEILGNTNSKWGLAYLNDIAFLQTGASFDKAEVNARGADICVLRGGNIQNGQIIFKDDDIYINKNIISERMLIKVGDIITPSVSSLEKIGKDALVDDDYSNVVVGGFVYIIRPYLANFALSKYLYYWLQAPMTQMLLRNITKKSGSAFYNLSKEKFSEVIVAIPPYNEMQRVIDEIDICIDQINNI